MADEAASGLQRAITILETLGSEAARRPHGVGVVEIARLVGREKSQVSRTLKTLAEAGLVDRDPDTLGYRLGWRLFTLAASAADQHLLAAAPGVLRKLVAVVGERAHLSVLQGAEVLTVLSESPSRAIQASGWVGRTVPLQNTSSGRALLFDHSAEDVHALLDGANFTVEAPNAPRDVAELLTRLHRARQAGYVISDEEFEPGLVAVAAPVRDFRGRVIAALNISAPKFRFGHHLDAAGAQVMTVAHYLSQELNRPTPAEPAPTPTSTNTSKSPHRTTNIRRIS